MKKSSCSSKSIDLELQLFLLVYINESSYIVGSVGLLLVCNVGSKAKLHSIGKILGVEDLSCGVQ